MSDGDTYLQFPLCSLAFAGDETERLGTIISFGFIEAGISMYRKLDDEIRGQKAKQFAKYAERPSDFKRNDEYHLAAMIGAQEIGITPGSIERSLKGWRALSEFRNDYQIKHGTDVLVRIRKGLAFEARDKQGIAYREFAVLSAVYSCIGAAAHPVRITKETVQARMMGYKSQKILKLEVEGRADKAKPLTLRQIGYTLDALHERQFFARARANERQTYYSHRLNSEQMEEELFKRKTASARFHAIRKSKDSSLMDRIKTERIRLAALKPGTGVTDSGQAI